MRVLFGRNNSSNIVLEYYIRIISKVFFVFRLLMDYLNDLAKRGDLKK